MFCFPLPSLAKWLYYTVFLQSSFLIRVKKKKQTNKQTPSGEVRQSWNSVQTFCVNRLDRIYTFQCTPIGQPNHKVRSYSIRGDGILLDHSLDSQLIQTEEAPIRKNR